MRGLIIRGQKRLSNLYARKLKQGDDKYDDVVSNLIICSNVVGFEFNPRNVNDVSNVNSL